MGGAYYNEWERFPAEWLCNLMTAGKITTGRVDQRSIKDVEPSELYGYERVHLFAGIAGWELALELARWPAGLPVWTGSCPCQPFSVAGKGAGTADERHLWPEMLRLVRANLPPVLMGEQVASRAGRDWLATVRADLEALGYEVWAADTCAAGVGAPHIRQRLWWVAYSRQRISDERGSQAGDASLQAKRELSAGDDQRCGASGRLGHPASERRDGGEDSTGQGGGNGAQVAGNPWRNPQWLPCSDGKARPTRPGLFPLAHGISGRVGKLRAAGNAIVPQQAAAFVRAFMEQVNVH